MAYRHVVKNPRLQSRIFLTNWFMKIVRPGRELDNNVVQFHVPLDMSKLDIKNYLKSIYSVDVARVNTRIQEGKTKMIVNGDRLVKKKYPDFKVAYVTLAEGTFRFPDMFPKKGKTKEQTKEQSTDSQEISSAKEITSDDDLRWF